MLNNKRFFNFLGLIGVSLLTILILLSYTTKKKEEECIRRSVQAAKLKVDKKLLEERTLKTLSKDRKPSEVRRYRGYFKIITKYANFYSIEPELVLAIIKVESEFKSHAVSNKGAIGLMQIMPSTAKWLCDSGRLKNRNLKTPEDNIQLGVLYLSLLDHKYKGNLDKMLAEYNGGPNAANKYPFTNAEVRNYVLKVKRNYIASKKGLRRSR